jgi:tetratricopeptide (TPR) repeat protein
MPRRVFALLATAWLLAAPLQLARGEDTTLQYQYLKIYLKINDADQLQKQGNYQGALIDFKDCYTRLQHIHNVDPSWESALVIQRMNDCRVRIVDLTNMLATQQIAPPAPTANGTTPAEPETAASSGPPSAEVEALKERLTTVEQELQDTKEKLQTSTAEATTLRQQLDAVNEQLSALKSQDSEDKQVGKLLTENKALTDKLAAAQKAIASIKSPNPKSAVSMLRTQLKNTQDKLDASEAANTALQDTTTTLRQQLDDAQSDLRAANQRLAAAPSNAPEYETLKRENEVMREILTRELQEQAHRDMAKRLAQEEFDRLRITSKVLQEQLDILGSPMTPPNTDQERVLLDSLRTSSAQVAAVPPESGNGFSAPSGGMGNAPAGPANNTPGTQSATPGSTDNGGGTGTITTKAAPTEPANNTNTPAPAPLTNQALATANSSVPATSPTPPTTVTPAGVPPMTNTADTNSTAGATPPTTPGSGSDTNSMAASTNAASGATNSVASAPETNPPSTESGGTTNSAPTTASTTNSESTPSTNVVSATPPAATTNAETSSAAPSSSTNSETTSAAPPASTNTVAQDNSGAATTNAPPQDESTDYAQKPRLPDDMRDTAQQAADLFKMQRYDDAAAKYQEIIDKYPESLYAWSNLGVVRFQQGKLPEALKALQQAVKLSPTDAFSYSNLGIVYYQMNEYENAISALERALALDPTNAKSHNYLGCACSQKGWSEVAEKEFLKAIEIDDTFGDAHFNLALVYATEKPPSLEMARRHYKRALELGISPDPRLEKLLQMDGVAQNPPANQ